MMLGLAALFLGWLFYRLFITRDLMRHRGTLAIGLLFVGLWSLLGWWLWS